MNTIGEKWETFEKLVVPNGAPAIQRQEMRRAFYAGAEAMFSLQCGIADHSEEAAYAMLDMLKEEMQLFASDVREGRA